jgi:hypothetical protein
MMILNFKLLDINFSYNEIFTKAFIAVLANYQKD